MSAQDRSVDQGFMQLALVQARAAAQAGEVPVGAVVVHQGQVIACGHNSPVASCDPSAHAEMNVLRAAALVIGNYRMDECTLYVTLEPCVMCSGAALHARLQRVVYGAKEPKTGAAGSVLNVFDQPQLNHHTEVTAGVLAPQCGALLQTFFENRRRQAHAQRVPLREDALRLSESVTSAIQRMGVPPQWSRYTQELPVLQGLRLHWLDNRDQASPSSEVHVFLHGPEEWSAVYVQALTSTTPSVAIDLPGFGLSDKPKKESVHSVVWHAQVLAEFLASLHAARVRICAPASMQAVLAHLQQHVAPPVDIQLVSQSMHVPEALRAAPYPDRGHEAGPRALRALLVNPGSLDG